ncbi:MAG: hypothetical protein M0Z50_01040 [Planctomycetia bacterium]|nr:hypothetical protein [Planctomycetia bacterium]
MHLFRIHIRPYSGAADAKKTFQYCLDNGVLGVGWRLNEYQHITDWTEYEDSASKIYEKLDTCHYIKNRISTGDLIWTRDTEGQYYLARVLSGWEYWQSQDGIDCDVDVANIFRCDIRKVEIDSVPGKVIACFRPAKTIQEVLDPKTGEYSKHLWNLLAGEGTYEVDHKEIADIFTMLDDEETEDLVFLYLQSQGWFVVPNSRKADTMSYEYLLVNPRTNEKSLVQVKTGNVPLVVADYVGLKEQVFLFQANEIYHGTSQENIVCITRKAITDFLVASLSWLPGIFIKKMDLVSAARHHNPPIV